MQTAILCHICHAPTTGIGSKNNFQLYLCSGCSTIFPFPLPRPQQTLELYGEQYFSGTEGAGYVDYDRDKQPMIPTFQKYLDLIEEAVPARGTMLDIGAATGFFLKLAAARGWNVQGVEPSPYAAGQGRAAGIDIRTGLFDRDSLPANSVDVVTMWDVIEHVLDPRATLEAVHHVLRPGGLIALSTPDSKSMLAKLLKTRWHLVIPPEHIYLMNAQSLRLLFGDSFEVLSERCIGKRFSVQYVLDTLARWQNLGLWRWMHDRVEGTAAGHFGVSLNLYDNIFVLAKRKD